MRLHKKIITSLLVSILAGCGGGSESAAPTSLTVTPSLGKVTGAEIQVFDLDNHLLAKGTMADLGQLSVNLPANWHDGVIIEVEGGTNVQYYDEGMGKMRPLLAGHKLHAISIPFRAELSVTALTEVIYQRAKYLAANGKITSAIAQQANNETVAAFAPDFADSPLIVPDTIEENTDVPSDSAKGTYASILAGWAQHAYEKKLPAKTDCIEHDDCAPLLDMIDDIAADFSDGALDGKVGNLARASIFFDATISQPLATLRSTLVSAKDRYFSSAQNKVTGLALADQRIGKYLAGSYDLTCHQSAPVASADNLPAKLVITHDGNLIATSSFGNVTLLADAGYSEISTFNNQLLFSHTLYTYRAPASAKTKLNKDGILINVLLPVIASSDPLHDYHLEKISSIGDGSVTISIESNQWTCSGFPQVTSEKAIADTQLSLWLPDGDYICQDEKMLSIRNQVMTLGNQTRNISTANITTQDAREEWAYFMSSYPPQIRAISAKRPNSFPKLGLLDVTFADGTALSITHSGNSELGYFDVTSDNYKQCINTALLK